MTIFIQSRNDGFRRCGEVHTRQGREFADDHFTEEQFKQLNDDPEITMVAGVVDEDMTQTETATETQEDEAVLKDQTLDTDTPTLADMAAAAGKAIEDGNTISSGAPSVEAMEDILGCSISSEQRDAAWTAWQAGNK
nr:HI1506-related protein [uncultured Desulfobacter sp.]